MTECTIKYYDDDMKHIEVKYFINKNGKKHGIFLSYYKNGSVYATVALRQKRDEWNYKNGKRYGKQLTYNRFNGKISSEVNYPNGKYICYRTNGQIYSECTYNKNGKKHGKCTDYYENGSVYANVAKQQKRFETVYENGVPLWKITYSSHDGKKYKKEVFYGTKEYIIIGYYNDGSVLYKETYKNIDEAHYGPYCTSTIIYGIILSSNNGNEDCELSLGKIFPAYYGQY